MTYGLKASSCDPLIHMNGAKHHMMSNCGSSTLFHFYLLVIVAAVATF